ncbi:MAPEG family [Aspergillus sclerotialis]|uniref:MAPEG family n=1 Tax=Aspergillus sclerotialis TaxID=2070753 RepID=A0A3A2ZEK9_9EURO|nr:MAPEG family [Aspergillus sclerotialis]
MSAILTTLGLRAAAPGDVIPNKAHVYIIANWWLAYLAFGTRVAKRIYGIDHNAAPREDLAKYGEAAVQSGKISRQTLDKLKRMEAAHANSMENFTFFIAGILLAVQAGVPGETINKIGAWYTVSRVVFGLAYIFIESEPLSFVRSVAYWSGNVSCISALVLAGKKL